MPTYHIALSLTRPPDYGDIQVMTVLREAVDEAGCVAIEITGIGLIVDCERAALDVLETAIRTKLAAVGGSLDRMIARRF
jgi:hypothetical protein